MQSEFLDILCIYIYIYKQKKKKEKKKLSCFKQLVNY